MTAFEQLCAGLGVAQGTVAAEVISMMVNEMIFSDGGYTDEEIVEAVTAQYTRWCNREKEYNQGYEIIAAETYRTVFSGTEYRIVLGRKETRFGTQYVTWDSTSRMVMGQISRDYFWGHYFRDDEAPAAERAARADYHHRLLEQYER